jgi:hypothetical protein
MQRVVCLAGILVLLGAAPARPKVSLGTFVRSVLPMAANNFAAVRGTRYRWDTYYVEYKASPKGAICRACRIYDDYARGKYPENWYVDDRWNSTWTIPKNEAYVRAQLGPVLSGFSLHRTVSYSYPTLTYRNPRNEWVTVEFYKDSFSLRIGRDLAKPVHVLNPPSKIQLQQLSSGASNLMRLALPDAANNFASLRAPGKTKDILGEDSYPLNASFGSMFKSCDISNVTKGYGLKEFQPKWVLNCITVSMAGTKAALEEPVRAAVYAAIPAGFTAITDPSALFLDDYRWDNSDSLVSVNIGSNENKGVVSFNISVFHFLPKPA